MILTWGDNMKSFYQSVLLGSLATLSGFQTITAQANIYPIYGRTLRPVYAVPAPGAVYVGGRPSREADAIEAGMFAGLTAGTAGVLSTLAASGARKVGADLEMARDQVAEFMVTGEGNSPLFDDAVQSLRNALTEKGDTHASDYSIEELMKVSADLIK